MVGGSPLPNILELHCQNPSLCIDPHSLQLLLENFISQTKSSVALTTKTEEERHPGIFIHCFSRRKMTWIPPMMMKKHRRRSPSSQSPSSRNSSGSARSASSAPMKSVSAGTTVRGDRDNSNSNSNNSASSTGGGGGGGTIRARSLFFGGGSGAGSSKHKRRLFRKDSSTVTEACSLSSKGSVQTDLAPWRVGTSLPPPRKE